MGNSQPPVRGLLLSLLSLIPASYYYVRDQTTSSGWQQSLLRRLQRFTQFTARRSPFYREYLRDFEPADITSLEQFEQLPSIDYRDWRATIDSVRVPYPESLLTYRATGGSSGASVNVPTNLRDEIRLRAAVYGTYMHYRRFPYHRVLRLVPRDERYVTGPSMAGWTVTVASETSEHLSALQHDTTPNCTGYPHVFWRALIAARQQGIQLSPRCLVTCASEVLTPTVRRFISETLSCPVKQVYGGSDYGRMASECEHGRLHIQPSFTYVEVQAPTRGEAGEVIVTNFLSHACPLIRVRTGDWARWGLEPCPCGSPLPYLEAILGRTGEQVVRPDGSAIWWTDVEQVLTSAGSSILGYQVIQQDPENVEVRLVAEHSLPPECEADLHRLFAPLVVQITRTTTLLARRSGKTPVVAGIDMPFDPYYN